MPPESPHPHRDLRSPQAAGAGGAGPGPWSSSDPAGLEAGPPPPRGATNGPRPAWKLPRRADDQAPRAPAPDPTAPRGAWRPAWARCCTTWAPWACSPDPASSRSTAGCSWPPATRCSGPASTASPTPSAKTPWPPRACCPSRSRGWTGRRLRGGEVVASSVLLGDLHFDNCSQGPWSRRKDATSTWQALPKEAGGLSPGGAGAWATPCTGKRPEAR